MKLSAYTRLASLVLAIGFFFACSSSRPTVDELVSAEDYTAALNLIEEQLSENPDQPDLIVKKAEINGFLAGEVTPPERSEFYEEVVSSYEMAEAAGATSEQLSQINELINKYWAQEHNAGTAEFESKESDGSVETAIAHFRNAVVLKPSELSSYISLSTAQYSEGKVGEAISTLNKAKNSSGEVPPKVYENLGFLYLQDGDPEQSVFYYELANKDITNNKNIAFGLVNAYISTSNTEKAIDLLDALADNFPADATIRNVFGTQLYIIAEQIMTDLRQAYTEGDTALVNQIRFEAEGVGEQAEEQLIQAYSRDTTNTDYIESLAVFYNNMTSKYLSLLDVAFESHQEALETKAAVLLDFAILYYEKLSNISPQNDFAESTIEKLKSLKELRFTSN